MRLKGTVLQGGGARGGALFGALIRGRELGRWLQGEQQFFSGTSFGSFAAAGLAMGMSPDHLADLYVNTDIRKLIDNGVMGLIPWELRKNMLFIQGDLTPLANWIDMIAKQNGWTPEKAGERLFINAVDMETNEQIVYCEKKPAWASERKNLIFYTKAFSRHGFGDILTRSMALPGLKAKAGFRYGDGGFSVDNGPISFIPRDADLIFVNMGFAGLVPHDKDTVPKQLLDRAMYAFEYKSRDATELLLAHYPNLRFVSTRLYEMSTLELNASKARKRWAIEQGYDRSVDYWITTKHSVAGIFPKDTIA